MEEEITFAVKGSAPEPYQVSFVRRSAGNLSAYCTCPAGLSGQGCRHRVSILSGDPSGIVSPNRDDVKLVSSWLIGTDIEKPLKKFLELEAMAAKINKQLEIVKKHLTTAMLD